MHDCGKFTTNVKTTAQAFNGDPYFVVIYKCDKF